MAMGRQCLACIFGTSNLGRCQGGGGAQGAVCVDKAEFFSVDVTICVFFKRNKQKAGASQKANSS